MTRVATPENEACLLEIAWHGIGGARTGPGRLEEVVAELEGLALPWSLLCAVLLPSRVPGFTLDALAASGRVVWVGSGATGAGDGRVALYRRERVAKLLEPLAQLEPDDARHEAILECLRGRGASFLVELEDRVSRQVPGTGAREFESALWDLVWAGRVTNDTFGPLCTLGRRSPRRRGVREAVLSGGRWSLVEHLTDTEVADTPGAGSLGDPRRRPPAALRGRRQASAPDLRRPRRGRDGPGLRGAEDASRRRLLVIEKVDGAPVADSAHRALLVEQGFVSDYRGMVAGS